MIRNLSNVKCKFGLAEPVRYKDSLGKVIDIRTIVILENKYMKKVAAKYGDKIIKDLFFALEDAKKDWAANILLYAITKQRAGVIRGYNSSTIPEWRRVQKEADKKKWKDYLAVLGKN